MNSDRNARWYLNLMAPNTKGKPFGWVYLPSIYVNAKAFHALMDDLIAPFSPDEIDLVAGPDAMGFVLGGGIAARMDKGFLTIRKTGRICAPTEGVEYLHYTGRAEGLEIHKPAFAPGTRVLLVDQWIETGGTIRASIDLIERQGGIVVGIASICIEETKGTENLREQYKCATAVVTGTDLQRQCNAHHLKIFDDFNWSSIIPQVGELDPATA
ncbi:adenine phosphoribosyltransferase [Mesorhizobium sp. B2-6-5]|nr:adenine phosphoribosyltransferase [Mesorhizobium sp. B2-6-5]